MQSTKEQTGHALDQVISQILPSLALTIRDALYKHALQEGVGGKLMLLNVSKTTDVFAH